MIPFSPQFQSENDIIQMQPEPLRLSIEVWAYEAVSCAGDAIYVYPHSVWSGGGRGTEGGRREKPEKLNYV